MNLNYHPSPGAVERLFDNYGLTLQRCVLRIVRDRADAEDILQEVFARALLKSPLPEQDEQHMACWLVAVARNLAYDHLRSRGSALARHVPLREDFAAHGGEDAHLIGEERARRVLSAVKSLRPPHKKVIELAYYKGLTQAEIAERMHQPLGTIKGRTRAAMLRLQTILGQDAANARPGRARHSTSRARSANNFCA